MLAPEVVEGVVQDDEDDEKVQNKSTKVYWDEVKPKQIEVDQEEILQKVDISGTTDWDPAEQWDACNLICEYVCIFSWNDLDLGKNINSQAFNQVNWSYTRKCAVIKSVWVTTMRWNNSSGNATDYFWEKGPFTVRQKQTVLTGVQFNWYYLKYLGSKHYKVAMMIWITSE